MKQSEYPPAELRYGENLVAIEYFNFHKDDADAGNPYNTTFGMKVISKSDGCKSVSEYIEKAVDFYNAYLCNRRAPELISSETVDTLRRVLDKCEHARSSALFKLSVEISMLLNVIAATNDIEGEDLGRLRHACIEEVRRINGSVSLDNAIEWQK